MSGRDETLLATSEGDITWTLSRNRAEGQNLKPRFSASLLQNWVTWRRRIILKEIEHVVIICWLHTLPVRICRCLPHLCSYLPWAWPMTHLTHLWRHRLLPAYKPGSALHSPPACSLSCGIKRPTYTSMCPGLFPGFVCASLDYLDFSQSNNFRTGCSSLVKML